jgi:F-type H+-transporting ATPase subunit a
MFVLFANLFGMVPYSFTPTSHIVVTFALAFVVFMGVTVIGFARHGLHFFSFFVPKGVPFVLVPLLVFIEDISYLIRPISLSVRLFVNMMPVTSC